MKPPIVTVIGSLSFASGCLVVASCADRLTAGSRLLQRVANENADAPLIVNQLIACLELAWPALLTIALAGATVAWLAGRRILAGVLLVTPLIATIYALSRLPRPDPSDLWFQRNAGNVECICRVESVRNKNSLVCSPMEMTFPTRKRLGGKFLVTIFGASPKQKTYSTGETITVMGRISQLYEAPASWQRNERSRLIGSRIFSKISTDENSIKRNDSSPDRSQDSIELIEEESPSTKWQNFWQRGREEIIRAHANSLGPGKGDLLSSMVLGDRVVKLPKEIKELFRDVGLSHLLAASGFNLSIVVASSYFLARLLPLRPQFASLFALLATACFVCLAGPSPSVVRAAMLSVFFLVAKLFARKLHSLAALSLVLTIALAIDPLSASDVGLQLSYLATAGIISGAQSAIGRPKTKGILEGLRRWLQDSVSVICLAQLSVLPIQLMYFQYAGVLFLPANLLVDPVVAPVTVLGFISSILVFTASLLPFTISGSGILVESIDKLTALPLDYMMQCASWLASIKGTMIRMGPPVPFALPIYYLCLAYFFYVLPRKNLRSLGIIVLLAGLSILLFRPNIPDEIIYLSKKTALTMTTKSGVVLNDDSPDWLSKQLLDYSGIEKIEGNANLNVPQQVTVPTKQRFGKTSPKASFHIGIRETKNFAIVSVLSSENCRETPLTWTQSQYVLEMLGDDSVQLTEKPLLIWTRGYRSAIRKCKFINAKKVYLALVDSRNPLIISRALTGPANKNTDGETFYPLRIHRKEDGVLVLR